MKTNHFPTHSHLSRGALLTALTLVSAIATIACDCAKNAALPSIIAVTSSSEAPANPSRKVPLKGVVIDILPDRSALMVKHEAIPGVMKAMTMLFAVDPTVLTTVKKDDAITALMSRTTEGEWRLDEVKVVPPAS